MIYWLQLLALSWVHNDEHIKREGVQWAFEVTRLPRAWMGNAILDGLSRIISGRFNPNLGEIRLSEVTRKQIISSPPFHHLFTWAGSQWPDGWEAGPFGYWGVRLPEYNHDLMKNAALHFADLPTNYFDVDRQEHPYSSSESAFIYGGNRQQAVPFLKRQALGPLTLGYDVGFRDFLSSA